MSNKVTGNESYYPVHHKYDSNLILEGGATLRQKALLEFMSAFATAGYLDDTAIAERADKLTTAYINQLNKEI